MSHKTLNRIVGDTENTTDFLRRDGRWVAPGGGPGGVSDGNKGHITVSSGGTVWNVNAGLFEPDGTVATHAAAADPHPGYQRETRTYKPTTTARTATAALADDPHLTAALAAGASYRIWISAIFSTANATMDYKYATTYSGSTSAVAYRRRHITAGAVAGTDNENNAIGAALIGSTAVAATTAGVAFVEIDMVVTTGTAGTFAFQWAQNTSDPAALSLLFGSFLEIERVN